MLICLDPVATCFMLSSMLDLCASVLRAMFMCLNLWFDLIVMPCAIVALLFLYLSFLCFGPLVGSNLDPVIFVTIHTPRPTSKVLDHPYLHVYACLLLCYTSVLASWVLGFVMLGTLRGLDLVRLYPMPIRPCLGVTIWDASSWCQFASCIPFPLFAPLNDLLAMLVCATCWLSMHLYTLANTFMHESCLLVCRPCFNTMKLWTPDSNLHLSPVDTIFCLIFYCLFSCLFAF